jgi:hypothetical protein
MASKRSGTQISYADRKASGRPNVTYILPEETVAQIVRMAGRLNLSRSAVVDLAVRELAKKIR